MFNNHNTSNSSSSLVNCQNDIECPKIGYYICCHCPKKLCIDHLNEHHDLNTVRVEELSDQMNKLTDSLANLTTGGTVENARTTLNNWRQEWLDCIESIYENYSQKIHRSETELNDRLNIFKGKLEPTITDIKTQLSNFKKHNQTSQNELLSIESILNRLYQCVQSIQCEITVETQDVCFEDLISTKNVFLYDRELFSNNLIQSYRVLPVENLKQFISSGKKETILWLDQQKQLHYIDRNLQSCLLKLPDFPSSAMIPNDRKRESDGDIIDIKWCSSAQVFLVLFPRYLYSFNPKTHQFTQIHLPRSRDYAFLCITCLNDSSLFMSYLTSGIRIQLWKYSSSKEISIEECLKDWDDLTKNITEWVSMMNINSASQIGLLIRRGETMYRRFELRDERLDLLKEILLDCGNIHAFFPFRTHYWFLRSSSGKYYVYSTETDQYRLLSIDFPFGLQELADNTVAIGKNQSELIFCDI